MKTSHEPERDLAFVSYSHEDRVWLERLQILLKPYMRKGRLQVWADPYIQVGTRWEREIDAALKRTRVAVLLTSVNFGASDFIYEVELPRLREAADAGVVTLFCIPVSSMDPEIVDLAAYKWARRPEEPLDLLSEPERNRAMVELAKALVELFKPELSPGVSDRPVIEAMSSRADEPIARIEPMPEAGALHGVPELPPHFVARPSVLQELKTALLQSLDQRYGISGSSSSSSSAGLHGQGGIGKSVLAAALARDFDVECLFPDGIFWITLGQEPDLLALQRWLLEAISASRAEVTSVNLGVVQLRGALSDKRCLVILDDVWRAPHTKAFDALGRYGRLLVTTRDREVLKALAARTLNLEVLSPLDARNLLAAWAQQPPTSLPTAAFDVAAECGYLPLALSLAGARARDGTSWTVLYEALREGDLEFLDHANGSVFKSLSSSVRALSPDDAARYRELAIFPEDTPVPEAVIGRLWQSAGLGEIQSRALLRGLADKALLSLTAEDGGTVVRLHDLQGDYLRLTSEDLPRVHARLLEAYRPMVKDSISDAEAWASVPSSSVYLWRYLFHHLLGADQRHTLEALATSPRWLAARVAASTAADLLSDLALLVERAPSNTSLRVERALRAEIGWIHQHASALESVLYNRLRSDSLDPDEIQRVVPGLKPSTRCRHPIHFGEGHVFRGHTAEVTACAYSPDGNRILSASADKSLREWERSSGLELRRFLGHSAWITACAYSPDGTRVLSASNDKTLCEWDRASGMELRRFIGHSAAVTACVYSEDGTRILSASGDRSLREWDCSSGIELRRFLGHTGAVTACAYSPDGERVLSASSDRTVREWDRTAAREIACLVAQNSTVTACAYAPDGARVVAASGDTTLCEWNRGSEKELRRFRGHTATVTACAYLAGGTRLLSASDDGTVREWDCASGKELRLFGGHSTFVTACAISPDGARVVTSSGAGILIEHDRSSETSITALHGHTAFVNGCAFSPDGERVLSVSKDGTLREWDFASRAELKRFEAVGGRAQTCAYSPDGSRVLSSSAGAIVEWDLQSGRVLNRFEVKDRTLTSSAYSPDGTRVLADSWEEWDCRSGELLRKFDLRALSYSPDGTCLLHAHYVPPAEMLLTEIHSTTGCVLCSFAGRAKDIRAFVYSPDGSSLLSGSSDGVLREWDRASGEERYRIQAHSARVTACAYPPQGSYVVSASRDNTLRIWSRETRVSVDTVYGCAEFSCLAVAASRIAAGDALGNVWMLECDWF